MKGEVKMKVKLFLAASMLIALAIDYVSAQELKDRQLKPAFDFTTIESPVEIVSIKLKGKEVAPGDKIKGDDDWLKGICFKVKNASDKPIAYVAIGLRFEPPPGGARVVVFILSYGVYYPGGEPRSGSSPLPIQPDQTVDLELTDQRYPNFLDILRRGGMPMGFDVVPYYVERVSFEDDPNIVWEGGYLKRKNPTRLGRFDIIGPYKLPTKR